MNILQHQQTTIEMMIRHENEMRELYQVYASKFPAYKEFWEQIAREEDAHANTVKLIEKSIKEGKASFNKERFNTAAIALSLAHINDKIRQAKNEDITIFNALSIALDIEKSLIENEYFMITQEDSKELQAILNLLEVGAETHLEKVKKAWEKEKLVK